MRRLQGEADELLQSKKRRPDNLKRTGRGIRSKRLRQGDSVGELTRLLRPVIAAELRLGLAGILERLDLPSRKEVDALSRRIDDLEQELRSRPPAKRHKR